MMTDSLLILSIGPVQGFIAQARRAADLYAGSQLLAHLIAAAIDAVGAEHVLYPRRADAKRPQSLPNKLIACLPGNRAQVLAQDAEKKIRDEWQQQAGLIREQLNGYAPVDDEWTQLWEAQLGQLPEIYWTVTPWPEGQPYEQVYSRAGRDFDARKRLRNFESIEERGRKCTVCGERAALHRTGETGRAYWQAVAGQVGEAKLRPDGREQLCAVCAVKRFGELGQEHFPSVSEMAAAPFKKATLEQLQGDKLDLEIHSRLIPASEQYVQALASWNAPTILKDVVPALAAMSISTAWEKLVEQFLRYDGEWLFPETYERKLAEVESSSSQAAPIRQAQKSVKDLLKATRDLDLRPSRPSPYYALIFADGDRMGKQIRAAAVDGPKKHITISEVLADFAANEVYRIVEQEHDGRVVYAGGDDVVALLPLPTALAAAEALRRAYAEKMAQLLESPTMSAGIAIAHHLSPLGEVLKAARQAEHTAKEEYGRDAIAVAFHKRGGVAVTMGAGWEFGNDSRTTIELLLDIQQRFAVADDSTQKERGLSLGLAHTLLDEARFLAGLVPSEARQAEVERLLQRSAPGRLSRETRQKQAEGLAPLLVQLAGSIAKRGEEARQRQRNEACWSDESSERDTGLVIVARWLLVLRFIVQETG